MNENIKKAQSKAASPEARAKAVATMKRRRAEKEAAAFNERNAALLKHATITKGKAVGAAGLDARRKARKLAKGIPLDMIPDPPKRKQYGKKVAKPKSAATRQEVVLALLRYLDGE